jgi:hypothetical protein
MACKITVPNLYMFFGVEILTKTVRLQIYSNGLYDSTLHRVINNSPRYRVCVAYFYEVSLFLHFPLSCFSPSGIVLPHVFVDEQTNFETAVEPLETCIQRTGRAKKFGRAVYGEHLVSKVLTNFS